MEPGSYFEGLAVAFVRGRINQAAAGGSSNSVLAEGARMGRRLQKFKRTAGLPRVQRVLGILRGFHPQGVLDIGSGRGAFLWPLLDAFPTLPVIAIDRSPRRIADIAAVHRGGVTNLIGILG